MPRFDKHFGAVGLDGDQESRNREKRHPVSMMSGAVQPAMDGKGPSPTAAPSSPPNERKTPTKQKAKIKAERSKATVSFGQITCPFCRNFYNNATTLRCGHTLCHDCLEVLISGQPFPAFPGQASTKPSPAQASSSSSSSSSSSQIGEDGAAAAPASAAAPAAEEGKDEGEDENKDSEDNNKDKDKNTENKESKDAPPAPDNQALRMCPICEDLYTVGELRQYRPDVALNRIITALVTNLPDHLKKKRAWVERDKQLNPNELDYWVERDKQLNPNELDYVVSVMEKSLKSTKEFLTPLGERISRNATEAQGALRPLGERLTRSASDLSEQASEALATTRSKTSQWIETTAVPWLGRMKTNIVRGYESLTTTPDVLMQREKRENKSPSANAAADQPARADSANNSNIGSSAPSSNANSQTKISAASSKPAGSEEISAASSKPAGSEESEMQEESLDAASAVAQAPPLEDDSNRKGGVNLFADDDEEEEEEDGAVEDSTEYSGPPPLDDLWTSN
eukprot:g33854.t1